MKWRPDELFPRVGFVVANMPMEPDWIIRFCNQRGTARQYLLAHAGMRCQATHQRRQTGDQLGAPVLQGNMRRTKPVCDFMRFHAPACNPGVFLQGTDLPEEIADWSLTSLQTRLIEIGARVVRHARAITFQLAEVAVRGDLFTRILSAIHRLRAPPGLA